MRYMGWIAQVPARQISFEMDSVSLSNAQPPFLMNMIIRFFVKSFLKVLYFCDII